MSKTLARIALLLIVLAGCGEPLCPEVPEECEEIDMPVNTNGWSKRADLVALGPSQVTTLQADLQNSGGAATIQFSTVVPFAALSVFPRARISWSVGGSSVTRIISVSHGSSISGIGAAATVQMYDASLEHFPPAPGFEQPYSVDVGIAPGIRPPSMVGPILVPWVQENVGFTWTYGQGGLPVGGGTTVTAYFPSEAGATSATIMIAPRVGMFASIPAGAVKVTMSGLTGTMPVNWDPAITNYPLPPNTTQIAVELDPAYAGPDLSVSFLLGIDG